MLGKALLTLAVVVTTSGALPPTSPQDPAAPAAEAGPGTSFSSAEAEARAAATRAEIAAELLGAPDHEWAGSYFRGDGLGANVSLDLAPGAGFLFEWHGCLGLYGRNYGSVSESGGQLLLEPELPNEPGKFAGIDVEFLPVSWGPRHYLVAAGHVGDFCNAVNGGSEPREHPQGGFLLRRGDETKPVSGRPRARDAELECVLQQPIEARIVSVGPRRMRNDEAGAEWATISVVLDAGREQGIREAMDLFPHQPERAGQSVRVTRVFERSSEAVYELFQGDDYQPHTGGLLSTHKK